LSATALNLAHADFGTALAADYPSQTAENGSRLAQSPHYRTSALGLGQGVCEGATGVYSSVNEYSERANNAEISQVRKSYGHFGNQVRRDGPSNGTGNNLSHDGPIKTSGEGNNTITDGPKKQVKSLSPFEEQCKYYGELLTHKLSKKIAWASAILNFISAPLRLIKNNPFTKFINQISLKLTKSHQFVYGFSGILKSLRKRNPLHLASFVLEAITSLFKLRQIYIFKSLASNTDILPFCIEHLTGGSSEFNSFKEGWQDTWTAIKQMLGEVRRDPSILLKKENLNRHLPVVSVIASTIGAALGLLRDDIVGGIIRNIGGIGNDFGLLFSQKLTEIKSGKWYTGGSLLDLGARILQIIGDKLGINNDTLAGARDMLHELALGSDKVGQRYFLQAI
jgi:hypothetical protein